MCYARLRTVHKRMGVTDWRQRNAAILMRCAVPRRRQGAGTAKHATPRSLHRRKRIARRHVLCGSLPAIRVALQMWHRHALRAQQVKDMKLLPLLCSGAAVGLRMRPHWTTLLQTSSCASACNTIASLAQQSCSPEELSRPHLAQCAATSAAARCNTPSHLHV
jgi:hypothetical protein